jgi:hypothetical protein
MKHPNNKEGVLLLLVCILLVAFTFLKGPSGFGEDIPENPAAKLEIAPATPEMVAIYKELSQPVNFEFECEPLRDVLGFLRTIRKITILVDEDVMEIFGTDLDCDGRKVDRRDIFITMQVNELSLGAALHEMLAQHGLSYCVERGFIYISTPAILGGMDPFQPEYIVEDADPFILKGLSQPVAFEFECEPLHDIAKFLRTITGLDIRMDELILEKIGEYVDSCASKMDKRDIFITTHVSELPFDVALSGMLRQRNLAYSVERDHIYISTPDVLRDSSRK